MEDNNIQFGEKARAEIKEGVDILANAVKVIPALITLPTE